MYHPSLMSLKKGNNQGTNAESVLNHNRRLILQLIQDAGVISRKALTQITGLKLATITTAIKCLQEMGIITEVGLIKGDSGRKIMGFSMNYSRYCVITLRMTPSYLNIGSYDLQNENLYIKKIFFDTLGDINHTCDVIVEEIGKAEAVVRDREIIGIGLGVEGPFVIDNGYYKLPGSEYKDGYFDIAQELSEKIDYPVIVNRSNNFGVYYTWKMNKGKNPLDSFVYITISYAIQCGIIINGELVNGINGCAGSIGNMTRCHYNEKNEVISLESEVSTSAVLEKVRELLPDYPNSILVEKEDDLNIRDVVKAFTLNDDLALSIFTEVGINLGRVVADLVNLLNPSYIAIGDELPHSEEMGKIIRDEAMKYVPEIVDLNLMFDILDYDTSRDTRIDPGLKGACLYIADAFIQSMTFGD